MCVYRSVYVWVGADVCTGVYMWICMCVHVCMCVHMQVCAGVCAYVCAGACVHVCVSPCPSQDNPAAPTGLCRVQLPV